jgi:hypothetical protein
MGYGTQEFMNRAKASGFGKMADWKSDGKTIGWIHKDGFRERRMHNMLARAFKDKVVGQKMFVCPGANCPLCGLVAWAQEEAEGLDEDKDFTVLYRTIKARDKKDQDKRISYTARDLAGMGDWKRKMAATKEFLFGWVRRDKRKPDEPVEVMNAGVGLATAIQRMIRNQIEDYGEERGDPLRRPYAIKITYDKDAQPAQKFGAERVGEDLAPLEEEVKEILATPMKDYGVDLERMAKADSRADILAAIELCWDDDCPVSFDVFAQYLGVEDAREEEPEEEEDGRTEREKKMGKAQDRRDTMHGRRRVDPEPADEGVDEGAEGEEGGEGADDDPVTPKTSRRPSRPPVEEDRPARSRRREEDAPEPEEEKPARSSRRQAEPEEVRGSRRSTGKKEEEPKPSGKGKLIACPECNNKVVPNRYGKCPECMAELDVPF